MDPRANANMHPKDYYHKLHNAVYDEIGRLNDEFQQTRQELESRARAKKSGVLGGIFGKGAAANIEAEIKSLDEVCSRKKEELIASIERNCAVQKEAFDALVQEQCVKLVEDSQVEEVVNRLAGTIAGKIKAADRSSERYEIVVAVDPYINDVFRQHPLDVDPVTEAARAHTVASELILRITMMFPQDPSGSQPEIQCTVDTNAYKLAKINFRYTAANGNFAYDF